MLGAVDRLVTLIGATTENPLKLYRPAFAMSGVFAKTLGKEELELCFNGLSITIPT